VTPVGLDLTLEVFGEEIVSRRLLRFSKGAEDGRPAFRKIAALIEAATLRRFESEGAFGGEKWAPLAESTLRGKDASKGILVDSGRLRASLTQETASDAIRHIGPHEMHWGSSVPYGKFHQSGTSRMPRRRPVKLPESVKRAMVRELQRELVGK
jgi:phage gpG-like protein